MDKTTQYVDEYAVLTQHMARLKGRAEELKAYFERLAVADLKDTKLKTMEYICLLYTSYLQLDGKA